MLREIYCEEFHQKKISLKQGLNVVLGTNTGDNSIGKSTFLLIIDFVLGGSAYANSNDILHNVKEHDIFFSFLGGNKNYYFARNNIASNIIWVCDENYNKINQIDIVEYKEWLNNYYQLQLPSLSFRDSVGRYIRVYGKKNYNEKRPLNYTAKEADKKACYALLKLFDRYTPVAQVQVQADNSADALKAYKKAQALAYIENIGKREFLKNVKEIERLELELNQLITKLDEGLLDLDSVVSEQALEIKENLSKARRLRGIVLSRLKSINENYGYAFSLSENSLAELQKYFPNINLEELEKIENFHLQISTIFKNELKEQKVKLLKDLSGYDKLIEECEEKLKALIQNPNLSKNILKRHAELLKEIERMKKENSAYEKLEVLKIQKNADEERLLSLESEQFTIISNSLNIEMARLNDYIYAGQYTAPLINFEKGNYSFFTPNDTGTGIAYKGLAVFDLAVLHLTKLPLIVHDSIILKQISDEAIEKLLEIYNATSKQIIISLDKADSYSEVSMDFLNKNKILELAPNGQELFGYSWGKKQNN